MLEYPKLIPIVFASSFAHSNKDSNNFDPFQINVHASFEMRP